MPQRMITCPRKGKALPTNRTLGDADFTAALVLNVTPGSDRLYVLARGIAQGPCWPKSLAVRGSALVAVARTPARPQGHTAEKAILCSG